MTNKNSSNKMSKIRLRDTNKKNTNGIMVLKNLPAIGLKK